ncbi:MAG: hypothetical protein UU31_C0001G0013 [Candidatus Uhrbacteria bacterium GW2011_GWA2_41_10]|nr:MAG: hypothetical protein UU31_C0001G0013 [Candidatus Uhrbacteria bacterium GW2011_GWA2_41_10]
MSVLRSWVSIQPAPLTSGLLFGMIFFFVVLFFGGIMVRVLGSRKNVNHYNKDIKFRLSRICMTMGFFGLIFVFFSYEQVRFLGARFWYVLWLVGTFVWVGFFSHYLLRVIPMKRVEEVDRQEKQKYLPGRKKHKKH